MTINIPILFLKHRLSLLLIVTLAKVSSASYNVYNYDQTTPQFTPDGLLKQVEYASEAPSNSMPMLIIPLMIADDSNNGSQKCAIIIATASYPPSSSDHQINGSKRGQSRIIEIPIAPPCPTTDTSLVTSSVIVGINGILSDNVSLIETARSHLQSWQKDYGIHRLHQRNAASGRGNTMSLLSNTASPFESATSSASRIAHVIADECQLHSFGGGVRPFGASVVVCGFDEDKMIVCVTNPSGAVESYNYHCTNEKDSIADLIVVGGKRTSNTAVRQRLLAQLGTVQEMSITYSYQTVVRDSLKAAILELLHENSKQNDKQNLQLNHIDLALITSEAGAQRLTENQMMNLINNKDK